MMNMNWIILIIAELCEVGFTYCLGRAKGVAGYEWWTCAKIMETKTAVTTPTVSNPQFQREAIRFGKENGQQSVYVISSSTEIPIMQALDQRSLATERLRVGATAGMGTQEHSPNVFLVMYDAEIGKAPLLKAIEDYKCEIKYDYSKINGMALKKPDDKTLEETMQYFKNVKGVTSVEYDHVYRLTDPVKPRLEIK